MKSKFKSLCFLVLCFSVLSLNVQAAPTPMPYFNSFEEVGDTAGWMYKNRPRNNNKWCIDTAMHRFGTKGLYVSCDNGATNSYSETGSGYSVVAYKKFTLAPGTYTLSFDAIAGGEGRGGDAMRVAWMPATTTPNGASMGATFPSWATTYGFTDNSGRSLFQVMNWTYSVGTVTVAGSSPTVDYYLAFVWKTNGGTGVFPPSAAIDNVQLAPVAAANDCHAFPTNLGHTKALNGFTVTWQGNATSYELIYFNTSHKVTTYTHITGITATRYAIPYSSMPAGVYSFRVRSICGSDTSIWVALDDILYYDPSAHCLDYLNFYAPGVTCTTGDYGNPFQTPGVVDNGPDASSSRHTVHTSQTETDPYTMGVMKTVPEGAIASVRLGNWETGGLAESITYTMHVPANSNLILYMQYAIILEKPGHGPTNDPKFSLEIMNNNGVVLDNNCTKVDFYADLGAASGWNTCKPEGTFEPIVWKDWTSIGVNLTPYAGQTIKIRLATYDCGYSIHCGYAYFTLNCGEAKISGLACGDIEVTEIEAPDGFNYNWYKPSNPSVTLGTDRVFDVDADDTDTYNCDVIFKEDPNCKFTLTASLSPRSPSSSFRHKIINKDCQNYVVFENLSCVVNDRGPTPEKCETHEWVFEDGTTTTAFHPDTMLYPPEGGTFKVKLITGISNYMCTDTMYYDLVIPPLTSINDTLKQTICQGDSVVYANIVHKEPGTFEYIGTNFAGCDSSFVLILDVVDKISFDIYDTICYGDSYTLKDEIYSTSGVYTADFESFGGCDSVVTLNLFVKPLMTVSTTVINATNGPNSGAIVVAGVDSTWTYTLNGEPNVPLDSLEKGTYELIYYDEDSCQTEPMILEIDSKCLKVSLPNEIVMCADESVVYIPIEIQEGTMKDYAVLYDAEAVAQGLTDLATQVVTDNGIELVMPTSGHIQPNVYPVKLQLNDVTCGVQEHTVYVDVKYQTSILAQRWNDVLGVKNEDYNMGNYIFDPNGYQWYKNDTMLLDEKGPILYIENGMLDFNSEYKLYMVRENDGYGAFTCPIIPVQFTEESLEDPIVTVTEEEIDVEAPAPGKVQIYSIAGVLVSTFDIVEGQNNMTLPQQEGVYILKFFYDDGRTDAQKIVVRRQ